MNIAATLLEIIKNTPGGVLVYCPNVNELCWEICEETGVLVKPERQVDLYESSKTDFFGDPYIHQRINHRKYLLKI